VAHTCIIYVQTTINFDFGPPAWGVGQRTNNSSPTLKE